MDLTMHAMAQQDPALSLMVGVVLHVQGNAPTLADLRTHVQAHLEHLPQLTHYLEGPGLKARWACDPAPDLALRIRERPLQPGESDLDDALQDLLVRPLPGDGPPWDLWLLRGNAPGRYALCYRAHHTTHDGAGTHRVLYRLFGTPTPDARPAPAPRATLSAYTRTLGQMLGTLRANSIWNDPSRPLRGNRASAWAHVPTDTLRAIGAARGGSANDALLAALAGALGTWSREHWPRGADRPVPAVTMVDLTQPGASARPGNVFTFSPLALPAHMPDAADRLDAVIAATRASKDPAHRAAMRAITDRTPARAFHTIANALTTPSRAIIDTSYVPLHQPLHLHGAPVTDVQMFTWLPRYHPASVLACSYNGTTSVYFLTDQALPELHRLPALWTQAVSELTPQHNDGRLTPSRHSPAAP
jgi:hypothetical protein